MTAGSYSTPYFFEKKTEKKTAARVAAFLRGIGSSVWNLGATGVRADWREQDGPALLFAAEIEAIYTDTLYVIRIV